MKKNNFIFLLVIFFILLISCNSNNSEKKNNQSSEKLQLIERSQSTDKMIHCGSEDKTKNCNCPAQLELNDSTQLTHIKNQFYKSKTGHLYERTIGQIEVNGHLTDHEYFNGYFSQEVDPLSFEPLDGWYAKDKNYVYYFRPVSGGMQISKLDKADSKTFKVLDGNYKYGLDKNYFYENADIIKDFKPLKTKFEKDKKGKIIALISNNQKYKLE
jgi:hypothetical protein